MRSLLVVVLSCVKLYSFAEVISMKDGVINVKISSRYLNRICVKNDRITSVVGLDNAFQFEKNDQTGEGYIKPTVENGNEKIGINISTASGRTQSLLLNVEDCEPQTIVLQNDIDVCNPQEASLDCYTNSDYEQSIVMAMKDFISEKNLFNVQKFDNKIKERSNQNVCVKLIETCKVHNFYAMKFELSTNSASKIRLTESAFSYIGDIALCLSNNWIDCAHVTTLYVLRWENGSICQN